MRAQSNSFVFPLLETRAARGGLAERAHMLIRQAILNLDLPPGAPIDKSQLCDQLGVSRFPISEALARLREEGLVDIRPQSGSRVARIRMADVRQAAFIRRALEIETVRAIAVSVSDGLMSRLRLNLSYQASALRQRDRKGFHALDLQFHALLLAELSFPRAQQIVETARDSLERARRLCSSQRRHESTYREHAAVATALEGRDPDEAAAAMARHIDAALGELGTFMKDRPDLFDEA
jgi:GntR family transcriptional regulator, rspAB operon transcriptional repressor